MPSIWNKHPLILYTISKVFLTFDIEGHVIIYLVQYRIWYSIHPMSFTAERKLPLPRLHHACAEESQHHVPWIPAPSFCWIPQLDPPWHKDLTRKGPFIAPHPHVDFKKNTPSHSVLNPLQLPLRSYPWSSEELYWLILISVNTILYW